MADGELGDGVLDDDKLVDQFVVISPTFGLRVAFCASRLRVEQLTCIELRFGSQEFTALNGSFDAAPLDCCVAGSTHKRNL